MIHFGEVVCYQDSRGFGFIREISNNPSYRLPQHYFHISNVSGQLALRAGDRVCFTLAESTRLKGKTQAVDVRLALADSSTSGALTLNEIMKVDEGAR